MTAFTVSRSMPPPFLILERIILCEIFRRFSMASRGVLLPQV